MNLLSAVKAQEADHDLTALVLDLMQRLSTEEAAWLQKAQDQWQSFRKVEAEREAIAWEGGSIRPLMTNARFEAITRERIASLQGETTGPDGSKLELHRVKTPQNLLQHLERGVPRARVSDLLGTPTYIHGNIWLFRYEETQVELSFDENGGIADVVVALCHGETYGGYNPFVDIPLGKLTLADILEIDPQITVGHRWSMRTEELTVHIGIGPPGVWMGYYFGALSIFSGAGSLQEVLFEWDRETERLVTDPKDVLINWMGTSNSLEAPYFSWFIK
nr:lysozyme inhibitor LprI family protein [Pseudomonas sp. S3E17]